MKVAIIHYWFVNWRGGEKVIEALLDLYPNADIYTHVYDEKATESRLKGKKINTTFINSLPAAKKHYQKYLPLMPMALEQLDLRDYDLVISSESGPAKGITVAPDSLHVCYCHSPMRYVWDMYPDYLASTGKFTKLLMRPLIHYLKMWDRLSADRVDHFIANASFIEKRINKFYRREASVIYPPVEIEEFIYKEEKEDFYLVLGQLTPYKRADLVVDAFLKNGKKLVVIGTGEQYASLKEKSNDNISILGRQDWSECKKYLSNAKALIFPGVEDFGMVPVEAMASGTPVIAFAKGGALETVVDKVTGLYFYEQTVDKLNDCISDFEENYLSFDCKEIRAHAKKFSKSNFKENFKLFVDEKINEKTFIKDKIA